MLKQMREGAKSTFLKLILFGLLLLAMAGLVLMDYQGMFRQGVQNNTIVSYDGGKLTAPEFDRIVQSTLRAQNIKQSDAYRAKLPQQILKREIDNRLFSLAATDMGLRVDDFLAAKQVVNIIAPLVEKGMSEKDALQRLLQVYNVSESQMIASLKSQLASQILIDAVSTGAHAPQQMVDDMLKYRYEWRRGEYFQLTTKDTSADKDPSEAELKAYYDTVSGQYALPEYRTLSVIVLDEKILGDKIQISEDMLKQYYDENINDYKSPETRVISQAIALDEGSAKLVYARALKTKDLQKAANKEKISYIKSATFTESAIAIELGEAAFSGEMGEVLKPLKSPLGWHVLHIEKVTQPAVMPFESVKESIEKDISQDKIYDALYQLANKIDDEIAGGGSVSDVAQENNIQEIVLEKIDVLGIGANGKKPDVDLPLFNKVVENGFRLGKDSVSQLIETPEGAFMVVGVRDIFPSEQQPFDRVRVEVLAALKAGNQIKALDDMASKIMERLKQGESFGKIAAEIKKTVKSTELLQRETPADKAKIEDNLMNALFSIDGTGQAAAVDGDGFVTLLRLAERKIQSPKKLDNEAAGEIESLLNRSFAQDLREQYLMSLMIRYDMNINDKLMNEIYAPKMDDDANAEE
ncbi:MAG: peptidyl-prolyl cis-trans isomerase [Alphaproteobacteria bacterium]|nr:peptidyl-prolyl cis-trans isomerase [Alphaproteobacteria bacterium]